MKELLFDSGLSELRRELLCHQEFELITKYLLHRLSVIPRLILETDHHKGDIPIGFHVSLFHKKIDAVRNKTFTRYFGQAVKDQCSLLISHRC